MAQTIRWILKPLQVECGLTIVYVDKAVSEIMHSLEGILHKNDMLCVYIHIFRLDTACV